MAATPPRAALEGGWESDVHRVGDTAVRSSRPWSTAVIALLEHLTKQGFDASPRLIGTGFDQAGNETLSYVPGESLHPAPWDDNGLAALGSMLADFHRVAADFVPPLESVWRHWFGRALGDNSIGFGHGDLGPWNIMAIDEVPVGIIDWDYAGPIDPVWDLAQAAWLNVQLCDDDLAEKLGLGTTAERASQLALFLDAYGLKPERRVGFVDKMIEFATRSAAAQAIDHGVTAETTTGITAKGYPFAWGMAWRVRSARWMLEHRQALTTAIS